MLEKYKEPLYSGNSEYLNLGISPGGVPVDNIVFGRPYHPRRYCVPRIELSRK